MESVRAHACAHSSCTLPAVLARLRAHTHTYYLKWLSCTYVHRVFCNCCEPTGMFDYLRLWLCSVISAAWMRALITDMYHEHITDTHTQHANSRAVHNSYRFLLTLSFLFVHGASAGRLANHHRAVTLSDQSLELYLCTLKIQTTCKNVHRIARQQVTMTRSSIKIFEGWSISRLFVF